MKYFAARYFRPRYLIAVAVDFTPLHPGGTGTAWWLIGIARRRRGR